MAEGITLVAALAKADELASEAKDLRKRTSANRRLCLLLIENGEGSPDEQARVRKLYPPHKTKTPDAPAPGETTGEVAPAREPEATADETPATKPAAKSKPAPSESASK